MRMALFQDLSNQMLHAISFNQKNLEVGSLTHEV